MLGNLQSAFDGDEPVQTNRMALARFEGVREALDALRADIPAAWNDPQAALNGAERAALCYALASARTARAEQLAAALQRLERQHQDGLRAELEQLSVQIDLLTLAATVELGQSAATTGAWEAEHRLAAAVNPVQPERIGTTAAHARALYDGGLVLLTGLRQQITFREHQESGRRGREGARRELDTAEHTFDVIAPLVEELPEQPAAQHPVCNEIARRIDAVAPALEATLAELTLPGVTGSAAWRSLVQKPQPYSAAVTMPIAPPTPRAQRSALLFVALGMAAAISVILGISGWLFTTMSRDSAASGDDVVLSNDFSNKQDDWPESRGDESYARYSNGAYEIGIYEPLWVRRNTTADYFTNVDVAVDTTIVDGPIGETAAGIVFRESGDRFYLFEIRADGYYTLAKFSGDDDDDQLDWELLIDWRSSDAIRTGLGETNRLRVLAEGADFRLYINETLVDTFTDDSYPGGSVGVVLDTYNEGGGVARFDNLEVRRP